MEENKEHSCDGCGVIIEENDNYIMVGGKGFCEKCFTESNSAQWHFNLNVIDFVDILSSADTLGVTDFYVTVVVDRPTISYVVTKEYYPSVFCVKTSREFILSLMHGEEETT